MDISDNINVTVTKACCEKCGQSLPQRPPLTTREKIEALKSEKYGKGAKGLIDAIVEILLELEARPRLSFATQTVPYTPPWGPYIPPNHPWPNTGDPLPPFPKIICNSCTAETNIPPAGII